MNGRHDISRLNCQDFLMTALDDVFPSLGIVLTFRFKERHDAGEIREAMRYMFTMYPRLRSVVEPTLLGYRRRILEDGDPRLGVLFSDAFRVVEGIRCGTDKYLDFRRNFLNEPFSLQQGLPLKMRYLPDDPQPMLLLSQHHSVGDGMSWLHLENSLLRYLNGDRPEILPLDDSSMLPAFVKKPYHMLPGQLYRSWRLFREDVRFFKGKKIISASARPSEFFSPVDACVHILAMGQAELDARSKRLGVSKSTLLLSALAMAAGQGPGRDKGDLISIAIPYNLRQLFERDKPAFGNYMSNFWLMVPREAWNSPKDLLNKVKAGMTDNNNRFIQNAMLIPNMIEKLRTLVGKKIYARLALFAKMRGLLPMTGAFTAIGSIDHVNAHGKRAQICETMALMPHYGLFLVTTYLEGKIFLGFIYPETEFSRDEMQAFVVKYDAALEKLLSI